MLELEYDLARDDFVAYNLFALNNLPIGTRQLRAYRIRCSVVALAVAAAIVFVLGDVFGGLASGAVGAAAGWLLAPWVWRWQTARNVRRMSRDDALGTPGRYRLEVDDEGIREESPSKATFAAWDNLQRVDGTPEHLFVFVGPLEAFLIPADADRQQVDRLVRELQIRRPDLVGA